MSGGRLADAAAALAAAGVGRVSRETSQRLDAYVGLLAEWQAATNLVGPSALDEIWTRHIADSAQLLAFAPHARRWLDLGSGAGFPGLVIAALLADAPDTRVDLVESNQRKCAFLREAARALGLPVRVHNGRIEEILADWAPLPDAVSARALAAMPQLVAWLEPLLAAGVPAFLHKGLDFRAEWNAVRDRNRFNLVEHRSRIGSGVVVELRKSAGGLPLET